MGMGKASKVRVFPVFLQKMDEQHQNICHFTHFAPFWSAIFWITSGSPRDLQDLGTQLLGSGNPKREGVTLGLPKKTSKSSTRIEERWYVDMGMGQNLVPLVNIKIAGKWMFIPLKMVLIGIDPYPYVYDINGRSSGSKKKEVRKRTICWAIF